jgi:TPR repeat protein
MHLKIDPQIHWEIRIFFGQKRVFQQPAKDFTEAYKWFNLASAQGDEKANNGLSAIEREMTPEQIAEAQRLAREFKP